MHFAQIRHLGERFSVAKRDIDDSMMGQGGQGSKRGALLPTAESASRDKQPRVFSIQSAALPQAAGLVPERLPLRGEIAVAGGNTQQESIVFAKLLWCYEWVL